MITRSRIKNIIKPPQLDAWRTESIVKGRIVQLNTFLSVFNVNERVGTQSNYFRERT